MQDTERSECTTQETRGILQDESRVRQLTLVTGGALFGIKSIGCHLEHVVALNADTVKNGAGDGLEFGRTLGSGRTAIGANGLCGHGPIVARRKRPAKSSASRQ